MKTQKGGEMFSSTRSSLYLKVNKDMLQVKLTFYLFHQMELKHLSSAKNRMQPNSFFTDS